MTLHLFNTLGRTKERFVPQDPARVSLYVCGPTVYDHPHIGNARPAVVFDVLYRVLRARFPSVVYARNITDVDDKINAAAAERGVPISAITGRFIEAYHEDMAALGVLAPDLEPKVTDHVPQIVSMIGRLLARGHAYVAEGHVLFEVSSFPDYGRLSGRSIDEMVAGARVEVAPFKRDPADFVLWKPSPPHLPGWSSPWGRGRPGWHIECSAMIEDHLGPTIDIHGGGQDLIFPHHENEIAQGTCAHDGALYCRYWLHNGFVTVDGRKMSKSLGNVLLVRDLLEHAPGEAVRLALLGVHYRQPLDWTAQRLEIAAQLLDRFYRLLAEFDDVEPDEGDAEGLGDVRASLEDDLNTPGALAALHRTAHALRRTTEASERARLKAGMLRGGALLGLLQDDPAARFPTGLSAGPKTGSAADPVVRDQVTALIAARDRARQTRDFAEADRLRLLLSDIGITLEDRPDGTHWRYRS